VDNVTSRYRSRRHRRPLRPSARASSSPPRWPGTVDGSKPTTTKLSRRLQVIFCHQSPRPEQ